MRVSILVCFLLFFTVNIYAQQTSQCTDIAPDVQFNFESQSDYQLDFDNFSQAVSDYVVSHGSVDMLAGTLDTLAADELSDYLLAPSVHDADFTGDGVSDVLIRYGWSYGGGYDGVIMLFNCTGEGYILADTVTYNALNIGEFLPFDALLDLNNNQRREIVFRFYTISGQKAFGNVHIYEWNGTELARTFSMGPDYGGYGIRLENTDDDPTTIELMTLESFAYESGTAMAFVEYNFRRPLEKRYVWDSDSATYQHDCTYFADEPTQLHTALHSAELLRACGDYDAAGEFYRTILFTDGYGYEPFEYYMVRLRDMPLEEQAETLNMLERRYMVSFSLYRLAQIALYRGELELADDFVSGGFVDDYDAGQYGHVYVAMAQAMVEAMRDDSSFSDACSIAETTYETTINTDADPGIPILDDPGYFADFYFYSGHTYGADPDNLFAVPEDINHLILTPVCLMES